MSHLLAIIGIGVAAFVSTNIDDLVLLVGLFTDRAFRPRQIVVGQFLGIAVLIAASLIGALLALAIPTAYVGVIGVVPIALGVRRLWRGAGDPSARPEPVKKIASVLTVTLVTIGNGGDNLSLYIPLFSIHRAGEIALFVLIFFILTALWCVVGRALAHPVLWGHRAKRWGDAVLPYVMIGLGLYIFVKTDLARVVIG